MAEKVTDLNQYRQEQERIIQEVFDDPLADLREVNATLEAEMCWFEWAMQALYRPLRCIQGGLRSEK